MDADTRRQLAPPKWFGEIVIRANLKADDAHAALAKLAQHLVTIAHVIRELESHSCGPLYGARVRREMRLYQASVRVLSLCHWLRGGLGREEVFERPDFGPR